MPCVPNSYFYLRKMCIMQEIFKPGTHRPVAGACLVSYNHFHPGVYVRVYECVYAPEAINYHWCDFDFI